MASEDTGDSVRRLRRRRRSGGRKFSVSLSVAVNLSEDGDVQRTKAALQLALSALQLDASLLGSRSRGKEEEEEDDNMPPDRRPPTGAPSREEDSGGDDGDGASVAPGEEEDDGKEAAAAAEGGNPLARAGAAAESRSRQVPHPPQQHRCRGREGSQWNGC